MNKQKHIAVKQIKKRDIKSSLIYVIMSSNNTVYKISKKYIQSLYIHKCNDMIRETFVHSTSTWGWPKHILKYDNYEGTITHNNFFLLVFSVPLSWCQYLAFAADTYTMNHLIIFSFASRILQYIYIPCYCTARTNTTYSI